MRSLINGKLLDDLAERDLRRIRLAREQPVVEAVLLTPEAALRRAANRMKWGLGAIYAVIAGFLIFLATVATPVQRPLIYTLVPAVLLVLAAVMPFAYQRNTRKFRERMRQLHLPRPGGSTVRLDEAGLSIAGRSLLPWSALAIDTVELLRVSGGRGGSSYFIIQSLLLATASDSIKLDLAVLTNGRNVVDNVFRRLRATSTHGPAATPERLLQAARQGPWGSFNASGRPEAAPTQRVAESAERRSAARRPGKAVIFGLCAIFVVGVAAELVWMVGVQKTARMFDPGEAERVLEVIRRQANEPIRVRMVEFTTQAITVKSVDKAHPSHIDAKGLASNEQSWRVIHLTLFSGWLEWDHVSGPNPAPSGQGRERDPSVLDPTYIQGSAEIARAAQARAEGTDKTLNVMYYEQTRQSAARWEVNITDLYDTSGTMVFDDTRAPPAPARSRP